MKIMFNLSLVCGAAALLGGCASTTTRHATEEYATHADWPADVQRQVRAGQVSVGFTREQVQAALGVPEYKSTALKSDRAAEVWGYRDSRPRSEYGFRPAFVQAPKKTTITPATADTPKFVVFFDREGIVTAVENVWW